MVFEGAGRETLYHSANVRLHQPISSMHQECWESVKNSVKRFPLANILTQEGKTNCHIFPPLMFAAGLNGSIEFNRNSFCVHIEPILVVSQDIISMVGPPEGINNVCLSVQRIHSWCIKPLKVRKLNSFFCTVNRHLYERVFCVVCEALPTHWTLKNHGGSKTGFLATTFSPSLPYSVSRPSSSSSSSFSLPQCAQGSNALPGQPRQGQPPE